MQADLSSIAAVLRHNVGYQSLERFLDSPLSTLPDPLPAYCCMPPDSAAAPPLAAAASAMPLPAPSSADSPSPLSAAGSAAAIAAAAIASTRCDGASAVAADLAPLPTAVSMAATTKSAEADEADEQQFGLPFHLRSARNVLSFWREIQTYKTCGDELRRIGLAHVINERFVDEKGERRVNVCVGA